MRDISLALAACLLVACLLVACGSKKEDRAEIDPQLEVYFLQFQLDIGVDTSHIDASFEEQPYPVLGVCERHGDTRAIKIDPRAWQAASDNFKEQLMYHELGHCALNLEHNDSMVVDATGNTVYGSIMNKYAFGDAWFYSSYRKQYKKALKNNSAVF